MSNVVSISKVDQLGALQAQIAALSKQAKKIVAELKAKGPGRYSGVLFDALVFEQEEERVDWKAVAEKLDPSRQLITAHTEHIPKVVLKVTGRKVVKEREAA